MYDLYDLYDLHDLYDLYDLHDLYDLDLPGRADLFSIPHDLPHFVGSDPLNLHDL